ncbi:MAG: DUF2652 domain-containing protein [Candidatus Margulisiibacteriota bacterium]|jgi:hypothetical protein
MTEAGKEQEVILIMVDISGYTKFMLKHKTDISHAQIVVSELMKSVITEIEIPLEISKLEGDAIFCYAMHDSTDAVWQEKAREISDKLYKFFDAFAARLSKLQETSICSCKACCSMHKLKLKVLVHAGKALLYHIGRFEELSGVDVILVHRLLKNNVDSDQYLLLTEPAYQLLHPGEKANFVKAEEKYDVSRVAIYVHDLEEKSLKEDPQAGFRNLSPWGMAQSVISILRYGKQLKKDPEKRSFKFLEMVATGS